MGSLLAARLRFDLQVLCGGGCPLTGLRLKIVDPIPANDRPTFDPLNGCRTAPQAASCSLRGEDLGTTETRRTSEDETYKLKYS